MDLVATAKRNFEVQVLLEQKRDKVMEIDALMNRAPIVRPLLFFPTNVKKKSKVRRVNKVSSSL